MAYVATDQGGGEYIYNAKPERNGNIWDIEYGSYFIEIPQGSIKELIGRDLTWEDEPVELE